MKKNLHFKVNGILPIDDQIRFIERLPKCEETDAIINSLQVAKTQISQKPENSIVIALSIEKALIWNNWEAEMEDLNNTITKRTRKMNELNTNYLRALNEISELNEIILQNKNTVNKFIEVNGMLSDCINSD